MKNFKSVLTAILIILSLAGTSFADGITIQSRGAKKGVNDDITSMTGLDNDGIPLAKVANAASDGANGDITSLTNLSGGQIAFPGTAVPSANVNTLDDYEEGTWTPDLQFGGAKVDITYAVDAGLYTKIGNMVTVTGFIALSSKGTSNGNAKIEGLPFTVKNNDGAYTPISVRPENLSFADMLMGKIQKNTTTIYLEEINNAGTKSNLTDGEFANTSSLMFSATYFTD